MKFVFIMAMASKNDNLVHSIIAEHPATSLEELLELISAEDFILIHEFYSVTDRASGLRGLEAHGKIILNSSHIGKIKNLEDRAPVY